jgi:hypothetical protein
VQNPHRRVHESLGIMYSMPVTIIYPQSHCVFVQLARTATALLDRTYADIVPSNLYFLLDDPLPYLTTLTS